MALPLLTLPTYRKELQKVILNIFKHYTHKILNKTLHFPKEKFASVEVVSMTGKK